MVFYYIDNRHWCGRWKSFVCGLPSFIFAFTEGIAAGAMLVMIAETMLPEAYFKGGTGIGMATLLGFLLAVFFKTLE